MRKIWNIPEWNLKGFSRITTSFPRWGEPVRNPRSERFVMYQGRQWKSRLLPPEKTWKPLLSITPVDISPPKHWFVFFFLHSLRCRLAEQPRTLHVDLVAGTTLQFLNFYLFLEQNLCFPLRNGRSAMHLPELWMQLTFSSFLAGINPFLHSIPKFWAVSEQKLCTDLANGFGKTNSSHLKNYNKGIKMKNFWSCFFDLLFYLEKFLVLGKMSWRWMN